MTGSILRALQVASFVVHVIAMNLTLGGTLLAVYYGLRFKAGSAGRELAARLSHLLPVTMAATIVTGLLPVLTTSELYRRYGYGVYVLMGLPWISITLLVLGAYYGLYLYETRKSAAWALGSALAIAAIAFFFTSNRWLMLSPGEWPALEERASGRVVSDLGMATLPRYLHFLFGALSVSSAWVVWMGLTTERPRAQFALASGARLFALFTLLEYAAGTWFLTSLPPKAAHAFLGGETLATALLGASLAFSVASVILLWRAATGATPRVSALTGIGFLGATLLLMVLMRERLRESEWATPAPELGPAALLLVLFLVFPAVAALMVALSGRPGRGRGGTVRAAP